MHVLCAEEVLAAGGQETHRLHVGAWPAAARALARRHLIVSD